MATKTLLRIGILLDSLHMPAWAHGVLARLVESDYAEIVLVVLDGTPAKKAGRLSGFIGSRHLWAYDLHRKLDRLLFPARPDALAVEDAAKLLAAVPTVTITPVREGEVDRIDELESLQGYDIDVFLQLGFRALTGRILKAARFGVWSHYPGGEGWDEMAGSREVFEGQPVTISTLYALDADKPKPLCRSHLGTNFAAAHRNRSRLCWRNMACTIRALKRLHELGPIDFFDRIHIEDTHSSGRRSLPANGEFLKLFSSFAWRRAKLGLGRLFSFNQWILMFGEGDGISASFPQFRKILPPRDRSWADPFVVHRDGRYFIFVEEMPRRTKKGHISLIEMTDDCNCKEPVKLIEKPYHLSYPFVFEWSGDYYMIPESGAGRRIDVFKCAEFPDEWIFHKTLMSGVRAVDTTLLYHDDRWWLFAGMADHQGSSTREELFLFYGDGPLSDSWTPHPQNPVISDVRRARPAGRIFSHDGHLYRPSQDCSVRYGYALRVNRITRLSTTEFAEEEFSVVAPDGDRGIIAVHTLNHASGLTVIDAKLKRWGW